MKYMLMSTSPPLTTGYAVVANNLMKGFLKKGVDIKQFGLQTLGHPKEDWLLPVMDEIYGSDAIQFYSKLYEMDYLITILDHWVAQYSYLPGLLKRLKLGHICHVTANSYPLPPVLADRIKDADYLVAPSKFVEKTLLDANLDPKKVFYIPHGINTKLFKPFSEQDRNDHKKIMGYEDKFVFLAVSTNTGFEKNWQGLYYAYKVFLEQNPDAKDKTVLHCHTSPYYQGSANCNLEMLGNAFGITDNLRFIAGMNLNAGTPPKEMVKLYNSADCYLSASFGESFGLPALEAMACGCPCIIPKHTVGPQLVGEPNTGLLIELLKMKNGDDFGWTGPTISDKWLIDPVDMADKMTEIYKDEKLRKKFSRNAVKFAKDYDWEKHIIPKWLDLFNHIENKVEKTNYKEKKLGI